MMMAKRISGAAQLTFWAWRARVGARTGGRPRFHRFLSRAPAAVTRVRGRRGETALDPG